MSNLTRYEPAGTLASPDVQQLVREQFGLQKATDAELAYFFAVAERLGLDPVTRQVHGVMRWDARAKRDKLTVQVGIDGARAIADRQGNYAGSDAATYGDDTPDGYPESASVTVWKIVQGHRVAFVGEASWSEFYPGDKAGMMWRKMPRVMLAKCAEMQALRKGWPAQLGQVYAPEETQADHTVEEVLTDDQVNELAGVLEAAGFSPAASVVKAKATKPHVFEKALEKAHKLAEERTHSAELVDEEDDSDAAA